MRSRFTDGGLARGLVLALVLEASPAAAAPGGMLQTPNTPQEVPIEVEIELAPAASLKQAPLWKELIQLLRNPYAPVVRRPGFGVTMPALNVWPLDHNFLTDEPLRLRTNDGEISWDQPGALFDPDEAVVTNEFNVPTELRTPIGALVASDDGVLDAGDVSGTCTTCGYLIVSNPDGHPAIPPQGTVVAVPAVVAGVLQELDDETGQFVPAAELEIPINEEDFFRPAADTAGVASPLRPHIGRAGAEVLGKALFWDMQVGSDGIQACGTCHFNAGVDNRTRNQLNPNSLGGDILFSVRQPNEEVVAGDFPFRKLQFPDLPGEGDPAQVVLSDHNDVMSSMGVRLRQFVDIPAIGGASFGPAVNGVAPLRPDLGAEIAEPIPAFTGLRRVEPRNTPTMHSAAFNLDNFWDGRARFHFNGGSVFGPTDPQAHVFVDPGSPGPTGGGLQAATNGHVREELVEEDPELAEQPVRIKFSSLGSQAVGPPLSDFEMSFAGRSWAKIGKKLLQAGVTPLANQLVATNDSRLGPFSNQGGAVCVALGRATAAGKPGLCVTYAELIRVAFPRAYWHATGQRLNGCFTDGRTPACGPGIEPDPFDGYVLSLAGGAAAASNRNQFSQMEANFSLFFGLSVQAYETLLIPDDTPFDRFMDANPLAANAIGEPGSQAVLFPTLIPALVGGGVTLVPGFGEEELFGFDVFAGGNLTAALPAGTFRNPNGFGSNPFTRSARCMLCHLGPEQTDHSINVSHGLLKGGAEFEFPTPPEVPDPNDPGAVLPAPEPPGPIAAVGGLILAEEVEEMAQDAVEVEPRSFAILDDPATPWDDRIVAQPRFFAFGDQGVYNIGLRPSDEDLGRGGDDPFGWPLSLSALALKNIAGASYEPCDYPSDSCLMATFDPANLGATFEETGGGAFFAGTTYTQASINPGYERSPMSPQLPEYLAPWVNGLPAGELHPQIDEMAGFAPNTVTPPNGGPAVEFAEYLFGIDLHCGLYDPAQFGSGPPNFGWGPTLPFEGPNPCPQNQSGVAGNLDYPVHGTWPVPNRVLRNGAFKAPPLRNVELTGPYFHTGSFLTLRQVVDFYVRGGDFPVTNVEERDPHIVDVSRQAFGFGRTVSVNGDLDLFADALPDGQYRFDVMPDVAHPITPEPATSGPEDAKVALVRFLLALTDERVRYERAPFDRPELFVPIDGAAPDSGGRAQLVSLSGVPCTPTSTGTCFRQVAAVGADGRADPLPAFLGVTNNPAADCVTEISHFCR